MALPLMRNDGAQQRSVARAIFRRVGALRCDLRHRRLGGHALQADCVAPSVYFLRRPFAGVFLEPDLRRRFLSGNRLTAISTSCFAAALIRMSTPASVIGIRMFPTNGRHWPRRSITVIKCAARFSIHWMPCRTVIPSNVLAGGGRVFDMVLEHECMHQETLLYMMQQLAAG